MHASATMASYSNDAGFRVYNTGEPSASDLLYKELLRRTGIAKGHFEVFFATMVAYRFAITKPGITVGNDKNQTATEGIDNSEPGVLPLRIHSATEADYFQPALVLVGNDSQFVLYVKGEYVNVRQVRRAVDGGQIFPGRPGFSLLELEGDPLEKSREMWHEMLKICITTNKILQADIQVSGEKVEKTKLGSNKKILMSQVYSGCCVGDFRIAQQEFCRDSSIYCKEGQCNWLSVDLLGQEDYDCNLFDKNITYVGGGILLLDSESSPMLMGVVDDGVLDDASRPHCRYYPITVDEIFDAMSKLWIE